MPATPKWAMKSRADERREKKAAAETHWREVCRLVTRREQSHCRVCGRRCDPSALGMLARGEHAHIIYRSAGGPDETWNVALLCLQCHQADHGGKLKLEGNADQALTIYRRSEDGTWHVWIQEDGCGGTLKD